MISLSDPKVVAALWALFAALIVAAATATFAFLRYVREQRHQSNTRLNALFSEIANIFEHYSYASFELPENRSNEFELEKRLRWAKYGSLRSVDDIAQLGFLDADSVKSLLQLELLMRNDDLLLDQLLGKIERCSPEILEDLRMRLARRVVDASALLRQLVKEHPHLEPVFQNVKKSLPFEP